MGQQSTVRSMDRKNATIANGAAVSSSVPMADMNIVGILMPAAWTAAAISFETSLDNGATWVQVWDDANAEVSIAAATVAARVGDLLVPTAAILAKLAGLNNFRIVSGVTGANVNQAAERTFTVILKS